MFLCIKNPIKIPYRAEERVECDNIASLICKQGKPIASHLRYSFFEPIDTCYHGIGIDKFLLFLNR